MTIEMRNLSWDVQNLVRNSDLIPGAAERHYVCLSTGQPYTYWGQRSKGDRFHGTITAAHSAMTTGRNDVALLSPDNHSQAASITWSKNMCHMIGAYGPAVMNQRARIGHSANLTAGEGLLIVSGYGNTFANLYMMHGRGNASNDIALQISGNRNSFINCHIGGPMHATEAADAGYAVVQIDDAQENYFLNCTLGTETIERGALNTVLRIEKGTGEGPSRNVFENCTFLLSTDGTNGYFIELDADVNFGWTIFKNCMFLASAAGGNFSSALPLGINYEPAAMGAHRIIMDARCCMFNTTDVVANGKEAGVMIGLTSAATLAAWDDTYMGLNAVPDHTA